MQSIPSYSILLTYLPTGFDITKNRLVETYQKWGPNYTVEFHIRILNTINWNSVYDVLHFTNGSFDNLKISVEYQSIKISSTNDTFTYDHPYESGKEYKIIIEQRGDFLNITYVPIRKTVEDINKDF